jgi:hypothetical protein
MDASDLVRHLRAATEEEVELALAGSGLSLPLTTAPSALEFFNCMVDVLTGVRAADETADLDRIKAGFGSTH